VLIIHHLRGDTIRPNLHLAYSIHLRKVESQLNPAILGQQYFASVTKVLSRNFTRRKFFRLCQFCEILRFINFAQRTGI